MRNSWIYERNVDTRRLQLQLSRHKELHTEQLILNGLIQVIIEAARTTNVSQTLIDRLLSNKPEHLSDVKVIPSAIGDQ